MPDLLSILTNASTGLFAHRAASATATHNLQNANTPGFSRQRAELVATSPAEAREPGAYIGRGVELATVTQSRDRFIERQMPQAFANHSRTTSQADALEGVHALDPGATTGLSKALGEFYSSMRALSQNASDMGLRQGLVANTRLLTQAFNRTAFGLNSARQGIDEELRGVTAEVNAAASALARLNGEIQSARAMGAEPNDLLDDRLRLVDKLAGMTGGTPIPDRDGGITISLPGGSTLVSGNRAATLSVQPDVANNGHLQIIYNPTDGSVGKPLPGDRIGGRIAGLIEARDEDIGGALTSLDQLAFDFATTLNTQHALGTTRTGAAGGALFTIPGTATGAASSIAINATVGSDPAAIAAGATPSGGPGDGRNMFLLMATENSALSGGLPVAQTLAKIVSDFGASAQNARALADQDASIRDNLEALRESASGVSIDEELVNLTKAQRAYEATLKVISTASEMLESLMQLK